jgi:DNA-binding XRE family transcriptional regulator
MIKNDKQYQITKRKLTEFAAELAQLKKNTGLDPLLLELQSNALQSFINEFKSDLYEYEELKNGQVSDLEIKELSDISNILIKARIIKQLSQAELANKIGIQEQQIQRYEATDYSGASLERIIEFWRALELTMCPVKVQIKIPNFKHPKYVSTALIADAQRKIRARKSCFAF